MEKRGGRLPEYRRYCGAYRDPVLVLIFSLMSFGIYYIFWAMKVFREINCCQQQRRLKQNIWYVIIPPLFWMNCYRADQALFDLDMVEGRFPQYRFPLWILLELVGFLFGLGYLVAAYQIQDALNRLWAIRGQGLQTTSGAYSSAELY